ncbi:hypothetical protein GY45DRAFT_1435990 [Cubamyces sp. BRFM 1775]|nr:hypothetical protein GY45DRAFT_1435990 [Cubamyces sp. BRFM 1775]
MLSSIYASPTMSASADPTIISELAAAAVLNHCGISITVGPALARVPMIIADVFTIVITWRTQYPTYSLGKNLSASFILTTVLIRDGTIYFVVLTVFNALLLAFDYQQVFAYGAINLSYLVNFVEPITSILISDFLTNLREAADDLDPGSESLASVSTLEFRIIGSIGVSLPGPGGLVALSEVSEGDDREVEASEEDQNGEAVLLDGEVMEPSVTSGGAEV